jgi:hypothetical protein
VLVETEAADAPFNKYVQADRRDLSAGFMLISSRTWRIASPSLDFQVPFAKAERVDPMGAEERVEKPGTLLSRLVERISASIAR